MFYPDTILLVFD